MVRDDVNRESGAGDERRRPGIFFWLLPVLAVLAVFFNARSGELLRSGIVLALGLYLVIDRVAPWERSAAWRWARGASVGVFCLLTLILLVRGLA